jgi:hypothetical protein
LFQTKFLSLLIHSHPQIATHLLLQKKDLFSGFDKDVIALEAEKVCVYFVFIIHTVF